MFDPGGAPTENRWAPGERLVVLGGVWIVLSGLCTGAVAIPWLASGGTRGWVPLALIIGFDSMAGGLALALTGRALLRRGGLHPLAWTGFALLQTSIAVCVLFILVPALMRVDWLGFLQTSIVVGFILFLIGFALGRPVSRTGSGAGSGGDER